MREETKGKLDKLVRQELWGRVWPLLTLGAAAVGMFAAFEYAPHDLTLKLAVLVATAYLAVAAGAVAIGSMCALLGYKKWRRIAFYALTFGFVGGSTDGDDEAGAPRDLCGQDDISDDTQM